MAEELPRRRPHLLRRAMNLTSAVSRHLRGGSRHVNETIREQRLALCRACSSCDLERLVCLEPNCGCQLEFKTRWASEACPLGKWTADS